MGRGPSSPGTPLRPPPATCSPRLCGPQLIFKVSFWILKRKKNCCHPMLKAKVTTTHLACPGTAGGSAEPSLKGTSARDGSGLTGTEPRGALEQEGIVRIRPGDKLVCSVVTAEGKVSLLWAPLGGLLG